MGRDDRNKEKSVFDRNNNDLFDRAFFGNPIVMIILTLVIVVGSILYNYFN